MDDTNFNEREKEFEAQAVLVQKCKNEASTTCGSPGKATAKKNVREEGAPAFSPFFTFFEDTQVLPGADLGRWTWPILLAVPSTLASGDCGAPPLSKNRILGTFPKMCSPKPGPRRSFSSHRSSSVRSKDLEGLSVSAKPYLCVR
jgi:hypothetical protein